MTSNGGNSNLCTDPHVLFGPVREASRAEFGVSAETDRRMWDAEVVRTLARLVPPAQGDVAVAEGGTITAKLSLDLLVVASETTDELYMVDWQDDFTMPSGELEVVATATFACDVVADPNVWRILNKQQLRKLAIEHFKEYAAPVLLERATECAGENLGRIGYPNTSTSDLREMAEWV